MAITATFIDAIKVQFLQPIFEDDFPDRGMMAWLTKVEWDNHHQCYQLFFDFTDFEAANDKYLTEAYYPNVHTRELPIKTLYTAKEAGVYSNKYSVYFSPSVSDHRDDIEFANAIKQYLKEVDLLSI